jgi:hypothetical protein
MTNPSLPASFTPAECARLSIFKTAVAAGLYSDAAPEDGVGYHFAAAELERLVIYGLAVAAGFYSDQLDALSSTRVGA